MQLRHKLETFLAPLCGAGRQCHIEASQSLAEQWQIFLGGCIQELRLGREYVIELLQQLTQRQHLPVFVIAGAELLRDAQGISSKVSGGCCFCFQLRPLALRPQPLDGELPLNSAVGAGFWNTSFADGCRGS